MHTYTLLMRTQAPFMHTRLCSLVYMDTRSNLFMHVASYICRRRPMCARWFENPIL